MQLCKRTKYIYVTCGQAACNVCAANDEDAPGYNEETYRIGKCLEVQCNIEKDEVAIITVEPPSKKAKIQKEVTSFFQSKLVHKDKNEAETISKETK